MGHLQIHLQALSQKNNPIGTAFPVVWGKCNKEHLMYGVQSYMWEFSRMQIAQKIIFIHF